MNLEVVKHNETSCTTCSILISGRAILTLWTIKCGLRFQSREPQAHLKDIAEMMEFPGAQASGGST